MKTNLLLKLGVGAAVVYVAYRLINKPAAKKTNFTAKRGGGGRMVVGATSTFNGVLYTYVFPEGNTTMGYYVQGSINLPQGATYTPH